MEEISLSNSI